jgi:hypothetical protein
MINNVKGSAPVAQSYELKEKKNPQNAEAVKEKDNEAAVLELNKAPEKSSATYSRPKAKNIDYNEVNRLIEEAEKSYEGLKELVQRLLSRQGKKLEDVLSGKEVLIVDEETRAKAAEAISENGEWGVEAVSDRLVAFAKAISGDDKTKAGELKEAIAQGFKEAEKMLGGKLPEISQRTYDETMRKLDEWAGSKD